jgi:hypothetical protein
MTPPVEKHLNYLADTVKLLLNRSQPGTEHEEKPQPYNLHSNYTAPPPIPSTPAKAPYKPDYMTMGIVGMLIFSALFVIVFLLTPWSEPIRNWFKGSSKTETQNSTAPAVRNFSLNVEHSVERSGHKGMLFHVRFEIVNAKGHNCAAMASFLSPNGTAVPAINKYFATVDNKMACWVRFVPGFDATRYDDLQLFMPYDQITTQRGRHDYTFCLRIWDVQTPITDCITGGLYVTNS